MYRLDIKKRNRTHIKSIVLALTMLFLLFLAINTARAETQAYGTIKEGHLFYLNKNDYNKEPAINYFCLYYQGEYPDESNQVLSSTCSSPPLAPACYIELYFTPIPLEQGEPNGYYWLRFIQNKDYESELAHYYIFYRYGLNNFSVETSYLECGPSNYLQFCITETDCLLNGGYWSNYFCYEEQINIIDFDTYYGEHSSFSFPTSFISSLAGFITPFLQTAGNLLETFKNNFDITQALEKGNLLGSAISQARGYLDLVNNFFGGLPVADMLLLFIMVIVLIVVIRIVIKIIHIVKP